MVGAAEAFGRPRESKARGGENEATFAVAQDERYARKIFRYRGNTSMVHLRTPSDTDRSSSKAAINLQRDRATTEHLHFIGKYCGNNAIFLFCRCKRPFDEDDFTDDRTENSNSPAVRAAVSGRFAPNIVIGALYDSESALQTHSTHSCTRARPFFCGQMKKTGNEMCFEPVAHPQR